MGGSGKTTLAKHVYYSNKQNFDSCCLLEDIEKHPDGLLGVQKKLLTNISRNNNLIISVVYEGAFQLVNAIQMNKVLIVVDDIDDKDKLSTLFGTEVFPSTKSKIIITTSFLKINKWFGTISCGCHVHKTELLNEHESLGLLSYHSFGSQIPMEGFEELAIHLAQYCEGNPLALKVLGSSLSEGTNIETWRSTMGSLNSLKGDLDHKIQGVLQKSFDTLPCDCHKELFLDIACLFLGEYVYDVKMVLEDHCHAESGMLTLSNRCLLTFSRDGFRLTMHKLLQDMARKIVHNKSKDPAERSRVWRHDECYSLLRKGDGSTTTEGLKLSMLHEGMRSEAFKTIEFGVSFNETDKIEEAVSGVIGVESDSTNKELSARKKDSSWHIFCGKSVAIVGTSGNGEVSSSYLTFPLPHDNLWHLKSLDLPVLWENELKFLALEFRDWSYVSKDIARFFWMSSRLNSSTSSTSIVAPETDVLAPSEFGVTRLLTGLLAPLPVIEVLLFALVGSIIGGVSRREFEGDKENRFEIGCRY
ncbi:hypothetical protein L1987_53358 [Smallanthus sonchifolius]|uniref:Uncharacterized protein n=1 Tax=Smallanthus sonchifolius TaxID=185202 RepID=A0ACB9EW27_9ASTR|nr:hypothetical protein L1987_53358 [Smallanthus sonchifolius]